MLIDTLQNDYSRPELYAPLSLSDITILFALFSLKQMGKKWTWINISYILMEVNKKMVDVMTLPISNLLLSISIPIILEAPAAFAPSATCEAVVQLLWIWSVST